MRMKIAVMMRIVDMMFALPQGGGSGAEVAAMQERLNNFEVLIYNSQKCMYLQASRVRKQKKAIELYDKNHKEINLKRKIKRRRK